MKPLRDMLDKVEPMFEKGGKLETMYPFYEAIDTFLFTPKSVATRCAHARDGIDLKRMMITVVFALIPCVAMAVYNSGFQANQAINPDLPPETWQAALMLQLGLGFTGAFAHIIHGALLFFPIMLVSYSVGGFWEGIFSTVRKHEVNEGFLVTGLLFPLTLPPTMPLWQVAVGITFGVVVGKEIFGGTGYNILNPALTARCFVFFAYPAQMSGDYVWTAVGDNAVDGFSGATPLAVAAVSGMEGITQSGWTWMQTFMGSIPGSMGETSTIACLIGAGILLITRVGSWRIMLGTVIGMVGLSLLLNALSGFSSNPMLTIPPHWHFVMGGYAFGLVYMATDPVSAALSHTGKFIYGIGIGLMVIVVRSLNPAFPEGMMLAILFMNVFAPLIDYYVMQANIKRRVSRSAT